MTLNQAHLTHDSIIALLIIAAILIVVVVLVSSLIHHWIKYLIVIALLFVFVNCLAWYLLYGIKVTSISMFIDTFNLAWHSLFG